MFSRRSFLSLLIFAALAGVAGPAFADDRHGEGGHDRGGHGHDSGGREGDDGHDGDGHENHDSHDGHDGHDDDGDGDGHGHGQDGDDDDGSPGKSNAGDRGDLSGEPDDDDDRIRKAVKRGEAESLRTILSVVRENYKGEIAHIGLTGDGGGLQYRIRIISPDSRLFEIRVNAKTGSILGVAGL
jgi:uncharacterized membrane protein YkoI